MSKKAEKREHYVTIRLEGEQRDELERRARENQRSLSGEIRFAVDKHLKAAA